VCGGAGSVVTGVVTPPDSPGVIDGYIIDSPAVPAVSISNLCSSPRLSSGGSASALKVVSSCSVCLRELDPISAMSMLRTSAFDLESPGCGLAARCNFVGRPMYACHD
jgi:hypothetical protein